MKPNARHFLPPEDLFFHPPAWLDVGEAPAVPALPSSCPPHHRKHGKACNLSPLPLFPPSVATSPPPALLKIQTFAGAQGRKSRNKIGFLTFIIFSPELLFPLQASWWRFHLFWLSFNFKERFKGDHCLKNIFNIFKIHDKQIHKQRTLFPDVLVP